MTTLRDRRRGPPGGRARAFARRCVWQLSDWTYGSGLATRLAQRLGLQGRLAVREHEFTIDRMAGQAPIRMVFASDFHAGPVTDPSLLDEACRAIAAAGPQLLLLGGDFVYRRARDVDVLARRLGDIDAPLGKFAVLGNHDYLGEEEHIVERLGAAGVQVLVNESARLPAPHDDVFVCGLDDPIYGAPDIASTLHGVRGRRILLMHAPDGLLQLGEEEWFNLALCGHTHGGQVALPFGIPLVLPAGRLNRRFSNGVYEGRRGWLRGNGPLLVSRGIGCSSVPVRLFAAPEIHVCTLRPAG
ncbi:MAG TPA: metallophosphoesterase [Gemmatimonadaceae bacterium]|nr:metallophosphoesterase [Gemmatimonadaceae bacterium]